MTRGYVPLLLLVSGLWGASYLFIKVALEDMEPSTMMAIRLLLAGAVMFAVLSARAGIRRTLADLRAVGRHAVVLGVINGALPFWLIAWGEKYVDSGVAAIANSTVPIFVALLAIRIRPSERASGSRLVGILVGLVGVAVLAGVDPQGGWWAVAGTLAIVLSSLAYARANLYTQDNLPTTPAPVIVCAVGLAGGLLILPGRHRPGTCKRPRPGRARRGGRALRARDGHSLDRPLHDAPAVWLGSHVPRRLPDPGHRARVRSRDPRRAAHVERSPGPRPHPARSRARLRHGVAGAPRRTRRRRDVIVLDGDGFRLRPAGEDDVAALAALAARPEIADSLASISPWAEDDVRAALAAGRVDAEAEGRYVLEVEEGGSWNAAGALAFSRTNRRSRIAYLFGVMVDPTFRGRGLGERAARTLAVHLIRNLGFHRVQLEVYGFNEQAQRLFERAGFTREGTRRRAYWRHGEWTDGVLYGLLEEDLRRRTGLSQPSASVRGRCAEPPSRDDSEELTGDRAPLTLEERWISEERQQAR